MKHDKYDICLGVLLALLVCLHIPPVKQALSVSPFVLPSIWSGLILLMGGLMPCVHVPGRICYRQYILGYAFSGAIAFVAAGFLLGVFLGKLSATPYDISPKGVFYNILSLVPALWAREQIRAYGIGTVFRKKRNPVLGAVLITFLFAVIEINYDRAASLRDTAAVFIYIARDVVPVILKSMVLSFLVYYGGAGSGIIYSLTAAVFQRVFPFLPSLSWLADSALGIAFPVLYSLFLLEKYQQLAGERMEREEEHVAGYGLALGASVIFAWFVAGVFPVYPSVVLTGSMEPGIFPGDAILIRKLSEEKEIYQLKTGDVINFKRDNITITHRILEVKTDEAGNVSFRTKGDNNKSPDSELVKPNDINGTVLTAVPKVGIPVLLMKSAESVPEGVVDK